MKPNLYIVDSRNTRPYPHYRKPYPNAADPNYFLDKVIDGMLALATVMGTVTIFFFLLTI